LVPPEGRRSVHIHIVDGLHVLCRRNKDGTVSRFFVARLCVNHKVRATELGSTATTSIDKAWQGLLRLRREADAEREARKEIACRRSPRPASTRSSPANRRR